MTQLLRCPEAAHRLGVTTREIYRLIDAGELAYQRDPDGIALIADDTLAAYLEAHTR